jgi:hypothetical protein
MEEESIAFMKSFFLEMTSVIYSLFKNSSEFG